MKLFLSAVEGSEQRSGMEDVLTRRDGLLWNLMSFYYARGGNIGWLERVRDVSRLIMVDSGAHSFQKGAKVDWEDYTHRYAAFIRGFDRDNVVGFFEMDVDNIIGYDEVLRLRGILESESGLPEKIIPVWHRNRGVDDFREMCRSHAGQVVAVTGFKNEDIRDEQYPMFVKCAWDHGCKIHCLGMSRVDVMRKVPFDYCDASSWAASSRYGKLDNKPFPKGFDTKDKVRVYAENYEVAMEKQVRFWRRWRSVCKDPFRHGGSGNPATTKLRRDR